MDPIMCQLSYEDHFWPLPMQSSIVGMESCNLFFGKMTLELNIFHLNNKHKLVETENQLTDEICSVGQDARKLNVQESQGIANQGEAGVVVSPSVATVGQLLSSESTSGKESNHGNSNIKPTAQATAWVEEIFLFDPP